MWWIKCIANLVFLLPTVGSIQAQTESADVDLKQLGNSIGLAYHSYVPCNDDSFVFMSREAGRPAPVEKYWDGSLSFGIYRRYIRGPITVILTLDNPASIYVNPNAGTVQNIGWNRFEIKPFGFPNSLQMTVQGSEDTPFPEVQEVTLNGFRVCKNITKWNPPIFGKSNKAIASPLLPKDFVIPFCGRKVVDHTALVTNGLPTKPGDWPWHVALYFHPNKSISNYRGAGTIITMNYILTAAHCVTVKDNKIPSSKLSVMLGKYNLSEEESHAIRAQISEVVVHNDYNHSTFANDIALMKTAQRIEYTDYIQPICMWFSFNTAKENIWGRQATAVGWGITENDTLSSVIQLSTMTIISHSSCLLSYPNFYQRHLRQTTFCAGNGNGTSVCNGDSGGGLLVPISLQDFKVTWFLRGIVSISVSRQDKAHICDANHYAVFTDVAEYLDWIKEHTDI